MLGIPARVFGSPQTQKQLITEQSEDKQGSLTNDGKSVYLPCP